MPVPVSVQEAQESGVYAGGALHQDRVLCLPGKVLEREEEQFRPIVEPRKAVNHERDVVLTNGPLDPST